MEVTIGPVLSILLNYTCYWSFDFGFVIAIVTAGTYSCKVDCISYVSAKVYSSGATAGWSSSAELICNTLLDQPAVAPKPNAEFDEVPSVWSRINVATENGF